MIADTVFLKSADLTIWYLYFDVIRALPEQQEGVQRERLPLGERLYL